MSANTIVIQGVVQADGSLQLEDKVPLPPGRVKVSVEPVPYSQETDPFFVMLRRIWAERERAGKPFRTGEQAQEALRQLREDAAEEVAEIGRIQEKFRRNREEMTPEEKAE